MKRLLMVTSLVILFFFTFGCQQAEEVAEEPAVDIAAEAEAVGETDISWAKTGEAQDVDAGMSFFADDGVQLFNGTNAVRDKEGVREAWSSMYENGWKSTWRPEKVVVAASGDFAYTYGRYYNEREVEGETAKNEGGYLAIWKKQADGSWKIVALK